MTRKADLCRQANLVHGATAYGVKSKTWRCWVSMRERCNNSGNNDYQYYGGRGIKVCIRWDTSFSAFRSDMGECPPGLTLEREDNNKGYEPGNCKWATRKEQRINQNSRVIMISFNGRTQCLKDWARELGFCYGTLSRRFKKGWGVTRMLTEQPVVGKNQFYGEKP